MSTHSPILQRGIDWYHGRNWEPFPFQVEMMEAYLAGESGVLNAPTGSGKTMAMWIPILLDWLRQNPGRSPGQSPGSPSGGLVALWITPLRALAKDIVIATSEACTDMGLSWRVEARTGDSSSSQREKQRRSMPEGLVTTPESLHVLFANKDHARFFRNLEVVVVDEWHDLLGTKRGVQTELVLSHLRKLRPGLRVWGISATIGNLPQAMEVLLPPHAGLPPGRLVKANIRKEIQVNTVLPSVIEKFPWSGHLGVNMIEQVLPILRRGTSTLVFTNTRSQCEIWYQALLDAEPDLAGQMAMHHGSLASELRGWVEEALHAGQVKVVVCTSSLDLGVDFRPVDQVIQVGGPKGVARFLQRAGRSGHRPGELSQVYFVPTHSLELMEASAMRQAVEQELVEERPPVTQAWDVLIQYLMTLATGDGLHPEQAWEEVRQCFSYRDMSREYFDWCLDFLITGGASLYAYDEYKKILPDEDGLYHPASKRIALQHRLSIGTIVSDVSMQVKFMSGGRIGTVEESFINQIQPGETFWFAGRALELVRIRNLDVLVKLSKKKTGKIPRWMGARMPLSTQMAQLLRSQLDQFLAGELRSVEMQKLLPLLELQRSRSAVPRHDECLIESIHSKEGHHLYIYPFEGRVVHEIMAALIAWRISQMLPITFSLAMNDYGFELLSDQEIPLQEALEAGLFSSDDLEEALTHSVNETEMARSRFREVARIAGLVFEGFPGKPVKSRHLQASTSLLFQVFQQYDPNNLLFQQAYREVIDYQVDGGRLRQAMDRLATKSLLITEPELFTPFCFPIMVDRLSRGQLTSESLLDRIGKMQAMLDQR